MRPLGPEPEGTPLEAVNSKQLTAMASEVCTSVCTSETKNDHDSPPTGSQRDKLTELVTLLLSLSNADREKLAALLNG